jgi:protein-disulfide isomerase
MTQKVKNSPRDNQQMLLIGIIVAAVVVAVLAIFISGNVLNPNATAIDYSKIPQGRTEDGAFILGDPNAPVTVIAFEDFLCPHCQDYQGVINRFIKEQVATGKARFEYRFLPAIDPTYSFLMANLAECSEILRPNSFWEAHDKLFEINSRQRFGTGTAKAFSDAMGLDYSKILDCTSDAETNQIDTDRALGDTLGVSGTPTVFIKYGDNDPVLQSPPPNADQLAALVAVAAGMPQQ